MNCVHGFEENSCFICRILKFSIPNAPSSLSAKKMPTNCLKPETSLVDRLLKEGNEIVKELIPHSSGLDLKLLNIVPKPNLLTDLPNFGNYTFLERLKEIELVKSNKAEIAKKISLENPEWKFEKNKE